MRTPIYVRPLTETEQSTLQQELRTQNVFSLRRCQIILASAAQELAPAIAQRVGCSEQGVRDVIHDFNHRGLAVLHSGSTRPQHIQRKFDATQAERLRALLHQSPRTFGKPTNRWTLTLAADVCVEQGVTPTPVSRETIRNGLARLGVHWARAKRWLHSPDPAYQRKKTRVIA